MDTPDDAGDILERIDVRVQVKLSAVLTLGLYAGPIDKRIVAENLQGLVDACGPNMLSDMIEFQIVGVLVDEKEMVP